MTAIASATTSTVPAWSPWPTLWRQEWRLHGRHLEGWAAIWLTLLFAMPVGLHPGLVAALGVLHAAIIATAMAGADVDLGIEAFTFALPPTRRQRWLARLALAGGSVLTAVALGMATVAWGWSQALWSLVVDSGLTTPDPVHAPAWYLVGAACPLAIFSVTFTLASLAPSREWARAGWIMALLACGLPLIVSTVTVSPRQWPGLGLALTTLALPALAALWWSWRAYPLKTAVMSGETRRGGHWWIWPLVILLLVLLLGLMGATVTYGTPEAVTQPPTKEHP